MKKVSNCFSPAMDLSKDTAAIPKGQLPVLPLLFCRLYLRFFLELSHVYLSFSCVDCYYSHLQLTISALYSQISGHVPEHLALPLFIIEGHLYPLGIYAGTYWFQYHRWSETTLARFRLIFWSIRSTIHRVLFVLRTPKITYSILSQRATINVS